MYGIPEMRYFLTLTATFSPQLMCLFTLEYTFRLGIVEILANFSLRGIIYQYSLTIYREPELRYFYYEYETVLEVHFFSHILHDSPLKY